MEIDLTIWAYLKDQLSKLFKIFGGEDSYFHFPKVIRKMLNLGDHSFLCSHNLE